MKKAISVLLVIASCVTLSHPALAQQTTQATYAKSDFIPGDVIFFEDTFENEKLGEFPSQWDLLDGYAEKYQEQPPGLQGNHLQPLSKPYKSVGQKVL